MEKARSGQGIRVLAAGSVLLLFLGIIYVWSVFVAPVHDTLHWGAGDDTTAVKLTSSFMLGFFVIGILISGRLQAHVRASVIVLIGGLAMAAGMLATSFAGSGAPWLTYITYGVVGGFGVGMAYNTIIASAQKWFPKKRGAATGITVCTFGVSAAIFAPLVTWMIGQFGLMPTFRILAAAFAAVTLALFALIKFPAESPDTVTASAAEPAGPQYPTGKMLRHKQFYFIALAMMLMTASYFILNPSFKSLAMDQARGGFTADDATVIVMMTGIASALGRLAFPALADKLGRKAMGIAMIAATAICTLALVFASGGLFVAAVMIIVFCYGGSSGIFPVITADFFGVKHVGSNYGAVMAGFALSALTFPMVLSLIRNDAVKFVVLAILAAMGLVMMILLYLSQKKFLAGASEVKASHTEMRE